MKSRKKKIFFKPYTEDAITYFQVTYEGTGHWTADVIPTSVAQGDTYTLAFEMEPGYTLMAGSYTINGITTSITSSPITISNVQDDIIVSLYAKANMYTLTRNLTNCSCIVECRNYEISDTSILSYNDVLTIKVPIPSAYYSLNSGYTTTMGGTTVNTNWTSEYDLTVTGNIVITASATLSSFYVVNIYNESGTLVSSTQYTPGSSFTLDHDCISSDGQTYYTSGTVIIVNSNMNLYYCTRLPDLAYVNFAATRMNSQTGSLSTELYIYGGAEYTQQLGDVCTIEVADYDLTIHYADNATDRNWDVYLYDSSNTLLYSILESSGTVYRKELDNSKITHNYLTYIRASHNDERDLYERCIKVTHSSTEEWKDSNRDTLVHKVIFKIGNTTVYTYNIDYSNITGRDGIVKTCYGSQLEYDNSTGAINSYVEIWKDPLANKKWMYNAAAYYATNDPNDGGISVYGRSTNYGAGTHTVEMYTQPFWAKTETTPSGKDSSFVSCKGQGYDGYGEQVIFFKVLHFTDSDETISVSDQLDSTVELVTPQYTFSNVYIDWDSLESYTELWFNPENDDSMFIDTEKDGSFFRISRVERTSDWYMIEILHNAIMSVGIGDYSFIFTNSTNNTEQRIDIIDVPKDDGATQYKYECVI